MPGPFSLPAKRPWERGWVSCHWPQGAGGLSDAPDRFICGCSCSLSAPFGHHPLSDRLGPIRRRQVPAGPQKRMAGALHESQVTSLIWRVTSNSQFSSFGWLRVPHQDFTYCQCCAYRSLFPQQRTSVSSPQHRFRSTVKYSAATCSPPPPPPPPPNFSCRFEVAERLIPVEIPHPSVWWGRWGGGVGLAWIWGARVTAHSASLSFPSLPPPHWENNSPYAGWEGYQKDPRRHQRANRTRGSLAKTQPSGSPGPIITKLTNICVWLGDTADRVSLRPRAWYPVNPRPLLFSGSVEDTSAVTPGTARVLFSLHAPNSPYWTTSLLLYIPMWFSLHSIVVRNNYRVETSSNSCINQSSNLFTLQIQSYIILLSTSLRQA